MSVSTPLRDAGAPRRRTHHPAALAPFASYFGVGAIYGSATRISAMRAVPTAALASSFVASAVVCAEDMRAATAALVGAWSA